MLNRINRSYLTHIDNHNGIREMLTAWTDKFDREATWDKIVAALRKIGENSLARQVEEQYIQQTNQTADGAVCITCTLCFIISLQGSIIKVFYPMRNHILYKFTLPCHRLTLICSTYQVHIYSFNSCACMHACESHFYA